MLRKQETCCCVQASYKTFDSVRLQHIQGLNWQPKHRLLSPTSHQELYRKSSLG
ncbi:hypothetical protein KC19_3G202500 [Ceratodon purpureus]|uniref:Uncharacterized protein n=1 Tax=Ceratodon purpureus TaxID=3225 RepID=A0A8T0IKL0_CERPU|nr:hypothetical protein KC19_3G202500 [Ceratodon purpureus]